MSRIIPIPYRKMVRVLEIEGFKFVRERGDHMIFSKTGILRPIESEAQGQLKIMDRNA